jgi:hypothetical protein
MGGIQVLGANEIGAGQNLAASMIDGCTPDLDQDLVTCNRRRRYIVEHQLPTESCQIVGIRMRALLCSREAI